MGAQKLSLHFLTPSRFFFALQRSRFNLYRLSAQAEAFYQRYGDVGLIGLTVDDRVTLHTLIALPQLTVLRRFIAVLNGGIRKNNNT